jgi:hypothetical protein
VLADAGLHGADVVAGQEVPVGALPASAVTGGLDELLLLGQVAVADGVLGAGLDRVGTAEVRLADRVTLGQEVPLELDAVGVHREAGDLPGRADQALADNKGELLPGRLIGAHPPDAAAGLPRLPLGHPGEVADVRTPQRVALHSLIAPEL